MFQNLRTSKCAFFIDMPNEENRNPTCLCETEQECCAFSHLSDTSWGAFHVIGSDCLNGVDNQ